MKYYKQFLYKITLNGSETIVTRKFPLQGKVTDTAKPRSKAPYTGQQVVGGPWDKIWDFPPTPQSLRLEIMCNGRGSCVALRDGRIANFASS